MNLSSAGFQHVLPAGWKPAIVMATLLLACLSAAQSVTIGSKKFPESNILGAMVAQLARESGLEVEHKADMGSTDIVWQALKGGGLAMYPEYTGTIWQQILKLDKKPSMAEMRAALAKEGIGISDPLGYNNSYVLVMKEERAEKLGVRKISDLAKYPLLKVGIDPEFQGRPDGWQPLLNAYGLKFSSVRSLDHGLVYAAVDRGDLDLTDGYGTDAEIVDYKLRVLEDDREFFPAYYAVFLFREDAPKGALEAMRKLEGKIDDDQMRQMNARVRKSGDHAAVAAGFLKEQGLLKPAVADKVVADSPAAKITEYTLVHLKLVGLSLLFAVLVGVPLGIAASRGGVGGAAILGAAGVIQTIPSLALLAMLVSVSFLGISQWTAVLALFLYSLLPIVRNTATGLQTISLAVRESAAALGLEPGAQLTKVYMPMASRTILAGVKTAAIINVGTAALAALIGAGGLGEPIINGLSRGDTNTVLMGAIPAAVLAILVQLLFDGLDRVIIPKGIR